MTAGSLQELGSGHLYMHYIGSQTHLLVGVARKRRTVGSGNETRDSRMKKHKQESFNRDITTQFFME